MGARRNILFIVIDQWRADALGCAGNAVLKTPNLDRLAADGVLFRRHFAQASPCGPSRATLLTGSGKPLTLDYARGIDAVSAPLRNADCSQEKPPTATSSQTYSSGERMAAPTP